MPRYDVLVRRRWFGEQLEQKLGEYDHLPAAQELLALAQAHQLGGGATLYVQPPKGGGEAHAYRVRDLQANP